MANDFSGGLAGESLTSGSPLAEADAVSVAACERALAGIDAFKRVHRAAIRDNANEHGQLYRVVNMHLAIDALADVFAENSALATCDRFFGEPATLYTSLYYERGSEQALHRELREEVGIVPERYRPLAPIVDPQVATTTYRLYAVTSWRGEPAILDQEHSELRWFPLGAATALHDLALEAYRPLFDGLRVRP